MAMSLQPPESPSNQKTSRRDRASKPRTLQQAKKKLQCPAALAKEQLRNTNTECGDIKLKEKEFP